MISTTAPDPWEGFNKGTQTLAALAKDTTAQRRQAEADAMAKTDWEMKNQLAQQNWHDNLARRALESEMAKGEQVQEQYQSGTADNMGPMVPPQSLRDLSPTVQESFRERRGGPSALRDVANPEYAAAMKQYGDQVAGAPATVPIMDTRTVNKPLSQFDMARKRAEMLAGQGHYDDASKAVGSSMDILTKIPDTYKKIEQNIASFVQPLLLSGVDPEKAKEAGLFQAKQMGVPDEIIKYYSENVTFPEKGIVKHTLSDGGSMTSSLGPDGTMAAAAYHAPVVPKGSEKVYGNPRTVKFGDELVKEHPIFEGANAERNKAAWEKSGGNFDKLGDFNGYSKKDNENSQKISVSVGTGKEKLLSSNDIEKLEERRNSKDLLGTLKTSYKPEYRPAAGKYTTSNTIGELELKIEKSLGNNTEAINWWNQYFEWANKELKKQSGAAVTPPEYKRFLQEAISTSTDPALVTKFLERREKRAGENYNQMADGLGVGRERAVSTYRESGKSAEPPKARPGFKIQRNKKTGEYREVPI